VSDRAALLNCIRENQDLDMPRLVYADFVEEFGTGDLDAATVEFIRLSCTRSSMRRKASMPRAAYQWVKDNWQRLIPTAIKNLTLSKPRLDGRCVKLSSRRFADPTVNSMWLRFNLYFDRGFLEAMMSWSAFADGIVKPLIRQDQPLAEWWPKPRTPTPEYLALFTNPG